MEAKWSWRPQESETVLAENELDYLWPQVEITRGPTSTPNQCQASKGHKPFFKIDGSCGRNKQAFEDAARFDVDAGSARGAMLGSNVGLSLVDVESACLSVFVSPCLCLPSRHP